MLQLPNQFTLQQISTDARAQVEALWSAAQDYAILSDGQSDAVQATQDLFDNIPPGKKPQDKFVLGIFAKNGDLAGVVDLIRDFPIPGQWMIGLLLLAPAYRSQALGHNTHKALAEILPSKGAKTLRIGVLQDNPRALKFWQELGYEKIDQKELTFAQKSHQVDILTLEL